MRMRRASFGLAACLLLAGCAGPASLRQQASGASTFRDPAMTVASARARIVIGSSSKQDLIAALGQPEVIAFESGYEVWAYREPGPPRRTRAAGESAQLVILMAPSGRVEKVRIRPAHARAGL